MQHRLNAGSRPQITFTSDFHELVQGDLVPGPCLLRYDPLRLITLADAASEHHHIRAHVRFHPGGSEWQGLLDLPAGLPLGDLANITGEGYMLTSVFNIPANCDELEVWFSCTHDDGQTHWDSDHGKNFWLRFGLADLAIKRAVVTAAAAAAPAAQDALEFEVGAKPGISSVKVRWRLTNFPGKPRVSTPLVCTETPQGRTWHTPAGGISVPKGAVVAFDIVYSDGGHEFTDDNQGRWYIAD